MIVLGTHDNGSFCSNDAELDVEKDVDIKAGMSTQTMTLKIKGLFNIRGEISKNLLVCLLTKDETGKKQGFNGVITTITPLKTTVNLTTKHDKITETLTKITEETKNGR